MKKLLLLSIILLIFGGCAVQETPVKEHSAKKRHKEIQKDLHARYKVL